MLNNVNMTIYRGDIWFVVKMAPEVNPYSRCYEYLRPTAGTLILNVAKRLGSVGAIVEARFHPG